MKRLLSFSRKGSGKGRSSAEVTVIDSGGYADVNPKTLSKTSRAAWQGDQAKLELALKKSDPNEKDSRSRTPLHLAAWAGHTHCVSILVAAGAHVDAADAGGRTPLMRASEQRHYSTMEALIDACCNLNTADTRGMTALHLAALANDTEASAVLCGTELSLDLEARNTEGKTPLHLAIAQGHEAFARELILDGANVNAVDNKNQTPLMAAAQAGNRELVQLLLEKYARPDIRDAEGWVAADFALVDNRTELADLIARAGGKPSMLLAHTRGETVSSADRWTAEAVLPGELVEAAVPTVADTFAEVAVPALHAGTGAAAVQLRTVDEDASDQNHDSLDSSFALDSSRDQVPRVQTGTAGTSLLQMMQKRGIITPVEGADTIVPTEESQQACVVGGLEAVVSDEESEDTDQALMDQLRRSMTSSAAAITAPQKQIGTKVSGHDQEDDDSPWDTEGSDVGGTENEEENMESTPRNRRFDPGEGALKLLNDESDLQYEQEAVASTNKRAKATLLNPAIDKQHDLLLRARQLSEPRLDESREEARERRQEMNHISQQLVTMTTDALGSNLPAPASEVLSPAEEARRKREMRKQQQEQQMPATQSPPAAPAAVLPDAKLSEPPSPATARLRGQQQESARLKQLEDDMRQKIREKREAAAGGGASALPSSTDTCQGTRVSVGLSASLSAPLGTQRYGPNGVNHTATDTAEDEETPTAGLAKAVGKEKETAHQQTTQISLDWQRLEDLEKALQVKMAALEQQQQAQAAAQREMEQKQKQLDQLTQLAEQQTRTAEQAQKQSMREWQQDAKAAAAEQAQLVADQSRQLQEQLAGEKAALEQERAAWRAEQEERERQAAAVAAQQVSLATLPPGASTPHHNECLAQTQRLEMDLVELEGDAALSQLSVTDLDAEDEEESALMLESNGLVPIATQPRYAAGLLGSDLIGRQPSIQDYLRNGREVHQRSELNRERKARAQAERELQTLRLEYSGNASPFASTRSGPASNSHSYEQLQHEIQQLHDQQVAAEQAQQQTSDRVDWLTRQAQDLTRARDAAQQAADQANQERKALQADLAREREERMHAQAGNDQLELQLQDLRARLLQEQSACDSGESRNLELEEQLALKDSLLQEAQRLQGHLEAELRGVLQQQHAEKGHQEEIQTLNSKNAALLAQVAQLEQSVSEATLRVARLQSQLNTSKSMPDDLNEVQPPAAGDVHRQLEELRQWQAREFAARQTVDTELAMLREQVKAVERYRLETAAAEEQAATIKQAVQRAESQSYRLQGDLEAAQDQVRALQEQERIATTRATSLMNEVDSLRAEHARFQRELAGKDRQVQSQQQAHATELAARSAEADHERSAIRTQLRQTEEGLQESRAKITAFKRDKDALTQQLEEVQLGMARSVRQAADLQRLLDRAEQDMATAAMRQQQLETMRAEAECARHELEQQLAAVEARGNALQETTRAATDRQGSLETLVREAEAERGQLIRRQRVLETQLEEAQALVASLRSHVLQEKARCETLESGVHAYDSRVSTQQRMLAELQQRASSAQEQLSSVTQQRDEAVEKAQELQNLWEGEVASRTKLGLRLMEMERSADSAERKAEEERLRAARALDRQAELEVQVEKLARSTSRPTGAEPVRYRPEYPPDEGRQRELENRVEALAEQFRASQMSRVARPAPGNLAESAYLRAKINKKVDEAMTRIVANRARVETHAEAQQPAFYNGGTGDTSSKIRSMRVEDILARGKRLFGRPVRV